MKFAVVIFPGSNCDHDALHVLGNVLGETAVPTWHKETSLPSGTDVVILPGGFSYGDYLRCGAIARFSPVMKAVRKHADDGGFVLGICNGFQVACEAGLLPGTLLRNADLRFHCEPVNLRVETTATALTGGLAKGDVLSIPIAHGDGNYFVPPDELAELERNDQIVFRYVTKDGRRAQGANPNGSLDDIAGVTNLRRNVVGLMPHPERHSESAMGSADGLRLFRSLVTSLPVTAAA